MSTSAQANSLSCSQEAILRYTPADTRVYYSYVKKGNNPQFYEIETVSNIAGFEGPVQICEAIIGPCQSRPTKQCLRSEMVKLGVAFE